jgi:CRP-like cAMP-binding protein
MGAMNDPITPRCLLCPVLDESVLADCPAELLEAITAVKEFRSVRQNETIYDEGDPVDGVYCQYAGCFALLRASAGGDEHIVSTSRVGYALGAKDLLQDGRHENGAVALEDSAVCYIPASMFRSVIKDYPPIIIRIMQSVCRKLTEIERLIERKENSTKE